MSRTIHGNKSPGYEYWFREANSSGKWAKCIGRKTKKIITRKIRKEGKNISFKK